MKIQHLSQLNSEGESNVAASSLVRRPPPPDRCVPVNPRAVVWSNCSDAQTLTAPLTVHRLGKMHCLVLHPETPPGRRHASRDHRPPGCRINVAAPLQ